MGLSKGWRKKPQQERSEFTANAILLAAGELFEINGYHHTTLESIAVRAGVGIGSVYDYFSNKSSIALTLYEMTAQRAALDSRKFLVDYGVEEIETNLPKVIRGVYQSYKDHRAILIDLVNEVPDLQAAEVYSFERLIHRASLMYLQIYEDRFPDRDLVAMHAFLILLYTASIKQYITSGSPELSEEDFLNRLSTTILDHLLSLR